MCLESYWNHISNTARGFGRLACYQPRGLLLDTPTLSAVCKCSSQKGLNALQKQKIALSLCRYDVILLILRNNARFFLFLNLSLIICFMTYINSSLGLKLITVMLTILAGKRTVFFFRGFTKCANFHGFLDIVGFVGLASVIVPSCIRGCFVDPKYINILSWLFCWSKHFSRENFVGKQKCDWGILTEIFK